MGVSDTPVGNNHAFLWKEGVMVDLGTLGGADSLPSAVNNAGQVVGTAAIMGGTDHAFLWTEETGMIDLNEPGDITGSAFDINDSGQVVGHLIDNTRTPFRAFLCSATAGRQALGTLGGGYSAAFSINETGEAAGESATHDGMHGFRWTPTTGMVDLGAPLQKSRATGVDINENGQIVGWEEVPSASRSHPIASLLLWGKGSMRNLGIPPDLTIGWVAVNNRGIVVGSALPSSPTGKQTAFEEMKEFLDHLREIYLNAYRSFRAFIWFDDSFRYLDQLLPNNSGWEHLTSARCINENGQIAGSGLLKGGAEHAYLLTPISAKNSDEE